MFRLGIGQIAGMFGIIAGCGTAHAQLLGAFFPEGVPGYGTGLGVTVLSRLRPEYEPPGVRIGDFVVRPGLSETLGYNSNLLGTPKALGSAVVMTDAAVQLGSNWARDSFATNVTVQNRRFPDQPTQNYTNLIVSAGGTVDVGRDTITLAAAHLDLNELPTSIDVPAFDRPLPYSANDLRASYSSVFGRSSLTPAIEFTTYRFGSTTFQGSPANQQFQDRNDIEASLTGRYEFAPQRSAVLVLRTSRAEYLQAPPGMPSWNSTGAAILAGLDYAATGVWRYRALVGYEVRKFDSAAYSNEAAPIVEADVVWTPTNLTTVTGTALRAIEASESVSAPAYTYSQLSFRVDHEYLKNVILQGNAGVEYANVNQGSGHATLYNFGAGILWLLNRNLQIHATYNFAERESNLNQAYKQNIMLLEVRLAL
jgi:hypothetical protein